MTWAVPVATGLIGITIGCFIGNRWAWTGQEYDRIHGGRQRKDPEQ